MSNQFVKISSASQLPNEWDTLATGYFQTSTFLDYTEKYNPCNQRYYILADGSGIKAGIVLYTLDLDLFTYLPFSRAVKMNIAGIPCSVSNSGMVGDYKGFGELSQYITRSEKGLTLFLNLDHSPQLKGFAIGSTLPSIVFKNDFRSWEHYLSCIRSSYRRRINLLSSRFESISKKKVSCSNFSEEMYGLYLDVLKRSKGKLETLSINFFLNLPEQFQLSAFYLKSKLLGWYIIVVDDDKVYFFMGGVDYELNNKYCTYFNLLINILRDGIEIGAKEIDFGQTSEIPKLRLGGEMERKYMIGFHSNTVFRKLLVAGSGFLEYKGRFPENNVIKES